MSIVVCDPIMVPHRKHLPHFVEFYAANKAKHELVLHMEVYRPLQQVQRGAVEMAQKIGASHVLFTEHDQWGYPIDGLDVLLEHDRDVIGLQTYQRGYPFVGMHMRKVDPSISFLTKVRNLRSWQIIDPVEETDLITWGFTLVKTSVFDRIDAAGIKVWIWDEVPTDSHFCEACDTLGIPRYICGEGYVCHGDIEEAQRPFFRRMFESFHASTRNRAENTMPAHDEDHREQQVHETEAQIAIRQMADEAGAP
jgi:hypothetical protein